MSLIERYYEFNWTLQWVKLNVNMCFIERYYVFNWTLLGVFVFL